MKLLILLLGFIGLSSAARAQSPALPPPLPGLPFDSLTHAPTYRGVVAVPGQPAAELQARAREWVALTFQDAHQVTQLDDPARGVLIGRGYIEVKTHPNGNQWVLPWITNFTFRLDFQDGRYRYELRDLSVRANVALSGGGSNASINSADIRDLANAQFQWNAAATATLASSQRQQSLFSENLRDRADYGSNGKPSKTWPYISADINAALRALLDSLAQHERAPAAKW